MNWINNKLYISSINTYIDPYKPVENAIITHAHADHAKSGHKNVLATKETIDIMKIRYGDHCAESFQVLNCSEKIKLVGPKVRIGRDATIGRMASIQIDGSIEPECFFSF